MRRRHVITIAMLWVMSLGAVAAVGAWSAQGQQSQPGQPGTILVSPSQPGDPIGPVIAGAEIGFQRVVSMQRDTPGEITGRWMVKVNGVWLIARPTVTMVKTP